VTSILALDTATDHGSVAVGESGNVAVELSFTKRRHASGLMPSIVEVLSQAGSGFDDLTDIVVADGPGSFTGLRIGFSTVKGILRELPGTKLHSAPSLLGLAFEARHLGAGHIAAMYDALRGDVFGAVYRFDGGSFECQLAPTLGPIAALAQQCAVKPSVAVGDGALLHHEAALAWAGTVPIGPPDLVPRASSLLDLMAVEGACKRIENPETFEPEYGRLAEAQVRLERAGRDSKGGV